MVDWLHLSPIIFIFDIHDISNISRACVDPAIRTQAPRLHPGSWSCKVRAHASKRFLWWKSVEIKSSNISHFWHHVKRLQVAGARQQTPQQLGNTNVYSHVLKPYSFTSPDVTEGACVRMAGSTLVWLVSDAVNSAGEEVYPSLFRPSRAAVQAFRGFNRRRLPAMDRQVLCSLPPPTPHDRLNVLLSDFCSNLMQTPHSSVKLPLTFITSSLRR